ncbi:tail fiber assembly protein [Gilliamella sp. BG2]|uniref:tail fiber assembly protein n=1 Tax=Gilliamella sp. BG2 TaxID=3351509 RepID=UPI0039877EBA
MKHFYSHTTQSFYIDEINHEIPTDSIEITEEQHNELYNAMNKGCVIFNDLTYSDAPPSSFHKWNKKNKKWMLDKEAEKEFKIKQHEAFRDSLLNEANAEIDILNRAIRLRRATDVDKKRLEQLENYTIDLYELDVNDINVVFPDKP